MQLFLLKVFYDFTIPKVFANLVIHSKTLTSEMVKLVIGNTNVWKIQRYETWSRGIY